MLALENANGRYNIDILSVWVNLMYLCVNNILVTRRFQNANRILAFQKVWGYAGPMTSNLMNTLKYLTSYTRL
jgi:hypothetical protein